MVDRCPARAEAFSREKVDRVGNKNPGGSRSEMKCESSLPKGQGFLGNAIQLRVSRS